MTFLNSLDIKSAIKKILSEVTNECVISSCGYISREVYRVKDRPRNFYMMGSMGMALPIGLGLAYQRPDLEVITISGDGAVLMSFGSVMLHRYLYLPNFKHYILDNECYASTGGQLNCFHPLEMMNTMKIIAVGKKSDAPRIPLGCKYIKERFVESIKKRSSI